MLRNNLGELLKKSGIANFDPTEEFLNEVGLSRKAFSQFCKNNLKKELTASQKEKLDCWTEKHGFGTVSIYAEKLPAHGA
jgi:hypothetical protein